MRAVDAAGLMIFNFQFNKQRESNQHDELRYMSVMCIGHCEDACSLFQ